VNPLGDRSRRRFASRRATAPGLVADSETGLASPPGNDGPSREGSEVGGVADVVFVVLTLVVLGLLALAARGVEKL
jgi:hypothetical protein